jgi:hypothetical protein
MKYERAPICPNSPRTNVVTLRKKRMPVRWKTGKLSVGRLSGGCGKRAE